MEKGLSRAQTSRSGSPADARPARQKPDSRRIPYGADGVGVFVLVVDGTAVRVRFALRDGAEDGVDVALLTAVDQAADVGVDVPSTVGVGAPVFVECAVGVTVPVMAAWGVFFRVGVFRGFRGCRPMRMCAATASELRFSTAGLRFRSADGSVDCARLTLRCKTSTNPKGMISAVKMANHCTARPGGCLISLVIFPPMHLFEIWVSCGSE